MLDSSCSQRGDLDTDTTYSIWGITYHKAYPASRHRVNSRHCGEHGSYDVLLIFCRDIKAAKEALEQP